MSDKKTNNYAFIDSQNLNLGIQRMGWNLDWTRFRTYLREKYGVEVAYLFIGYMPEHQEMYVSLQLAGFVVIHKPVLVSKEGEVKGNIDAELVLQVMIDYDRYDKALIVTGDGDFASLVTYLYTKDKLLGVLAPNQSRYSALLKEAAKEKIFFMNRLRGKLEYKKKHRS